MSKKKSSKSAKKGGKSAPKKKVVVKKAAAGKKSAPKSKKPLPKKVVGKAKPVVAKAAKTVASKPEIKKNHTPVKIQKPELKPQNIKAPVAPLVNGGIKPVNTPAPKKEKVKAVVVPPPPRPDLPKLPKGIVLKKQRGKLAPGEKRVVKTDIITHHVITDIDTLESQKKAGPEPKGKFTLEYVLHCPVTLLYDFLTTPNGLAEWFADGVDMKNDIYTFDWDGQKQNAKIVGAKIDSYIRLRWMDRPEGYYFEFRILQDELTGDVSLLVTDFGESEDDVATSQRLWASQIQRLIKALGTY